MVKYVRTLLRFLQQVFRAVLDLMHFLQAKKPEKRQEIRITNMNGQVYT